MEKADEPEAPALEERLASLQSLEDTLLRKISGTAEDDMSAILGLQKSMAEKPERHASPAVEGSRGGAISPLPAPSGLLSNGADDAAYHAESSQKLNAAANSPHTARVLADLPSKQGSTMHSYHSPPPTNVGDLQNQLNNVLQTMYSKEVDEFRSQLLDAKYSLALVEADKEELRDRLKLADSDRERLLQELNEMANIKVSLAEALTDRERYHGEAKMLSECMVKTKVELAEVKVNLDDQSELIRMKQQELEFVVKEMAEREDEMFQVKVLLSETMKEIDGDREAAKTLKEANARLEKDKSFLMNSREGMENELSELHYHLERVCKETGMEVPVLKHGHATSRASSFSEERPLEAQRRSSRPPTPTQAPVPMQAPTPTPSPDTNTASAPVPSRKGKEKVNASTPVVHANETGVTTDRPPSPTPVPATNPPPRTEGNTTAPTTTAPTTTAPTTTAPTTTAPTTTAPTNAPKKVSVPPKPPTPKPQPVQHAKSTPQTPGNVPPSPSVFGALTPTTPGGMFGAMTPTTPADADIWDMEK